MVRSGQFFDFQFSAKVTTNPDGCVHFFLNTEKLNTEKLYSLVLIQIESLRT